MDYLQKLIIDIELHSVEGIRACFENGVSPNQRYNDKPLFEELTSQYTRTPRFRDCVQAFVDYGLEYGNNPLLAVLLDDAALLEQLIAEDPGLVARQHRLTCAFTPLEGVTLLHVCAEFNHLACARVLVAHGADVNAPAQTDRYGFGGHTPVFHTVNQHGNFSMDMLTFLVSQSATPDYPVRGLIWGKGYPWETFVPAVNPISYAMMGLLRQFQRTESDVYEVVKMLLKAAWGIDYQPENIPNRYLRQ